MFIIQLTVFSEDAVSADEPIDEDWPMFRLDYLHTGFKEGLAPDTNQTMWEFNTGTNNRWIVSSPMIVDDYVYIGSENGKLYKLYLENGTEVWNYTADAGGGWAHFWSSPYVDKENNMVLCHADGVHAVNMTTGERIWHFDSAVREFSSPVVHDGVVFVGSFDNCVYALPQTDPNGDGTISQQEIVWIYYSGEYQNGVRVEDTGGAVSTTLAVFDGMVIGAEQTQMDSGSSYCDYNAFAIPEVDEDGSGEIEHDEIIWKYEIGEHLPIIDTGVPGEGGDCFSSPSVNLDLGQIYIGSRDQFVYCLAIEPQGDGLDNDGDGFFDNEGELIWRAPVDNEVYSSPSIHDGNIFVGSGMYNTGGSPGSVYCLRESDGGEVWRYPNTDGFLSSPLVADGKVFIGSNDENLYVFHEENGTVMWSYHPTGGGQNAIGSSPSLYEDQVVVGCCNGKVYAFHTPRINYPPEVDLLSPENNAIFVSSETPVLQWLGSDPNPGDTLSHDVYLSTSKNDVDDLKSNARVSSGQSQESFEMTQIKEGERYFWKIVVSDGEYESESARWSISVNTKPSIELLNPEDESIIDTIDVTIHWNSDDDDGDDLFFDVYLDTDSDPTDLVSENQSSHSFDAEELEDGETYYWMISAKDEMEATESPIWSFTINLPGETNNPPTIQLVSPEDAGIFDTTTVTLIWEGDDEDDDSLSYTVFIDMNEEPVTVAAEDIGESSYEVYDLQDGETYFWKIKVSDGIDETESPIWSFSVNTYQETNIPPEIDLLYPEDGITLTSNAIQLVWRASDEDKDKLTFDVYLGINPNSTTIVSQDQYESSYQTIGLVPGQTYCWKVVVSDGTHEVSSEFWNLTVEEKTEEGDKDEEFYEVIFDEPLYLGSIGALIVIIIMVFVFIAMRRQEGQGWDDWEENWEEDWEDWD